MTESEGTSEPNYGDSPDSTVPDQVFPVPSDPYFVGLRTWFDLDSRIPRARTELERARYLCASVHGRWTHSNDDEPSDNDPISILKESARGKRFRCVQFGIVLAGALGAFGLPARVVSMMSADVETRESGASHVVTEAWLSSLKKWVMFDAQENALVSFNGTPLSCAEIASHLRVPGITVEIPALPPSVDPRIYLGIEGFGLNFYYFQTRVDQRRFDLSQAGNERDRPTIMLCPMGAPEPRAFQRLTPLPEREVHSVLDRVLQGTSPVAPLHVNPTRAV